MTTAVFQVSISAHFVTYGLILFHNTYSFPSENLFLVSELLPYFSVRDYTPVEFEFLPKLKRTVLLLTQDLHSLLFSSPSERLPPM